MKNSTSYVISGVLAVAILVLYILHFTSKPKNDSGVTTVELSKTKDNVLPIAYVRVDSLLTNYNYAKDLNESLMRKEESSRAALNQRENQIAAAAKEFQRLVQNNAFLTQERAQQEQQRILKMQQDFQQMAQKMQQDFILEQQKLNIQMEDTIKVRIQEYNKTKGYQVIFTTTGSNNILYGDKIYDITQDVTNFLNKKYGPVTIATDKKDKK